MFRRLLLRGGLLKVGVMVLVLALVSVGAFLTRSPERARAAIQGPVAEYSFDEGTIGTQGGTVEDLSGNGNGGTVEGATWSGGRYGESLEFKGEEGECVTVPTSDSLQLSEEFTIEAWVKATAPFLDDPIVDKEGGAGYALDLGVNHDGILEGIAEGEEVSASSVLEPEVWRHVAFTYDGDEMQLFSDGVHASGELVGPLSLSSTGDLQIGCGGGHTFRGRIDEVRIYERALDAAEITADMEAPIATPKAGPVAEYSFDGLEEGATTAEDQSGHGHTATIHGAKPTPHGRYGGAMEFKASEDDYLSVPDSPELDPTEELTVEAWVRPSSEHDWGLVAAKELGGGGPEARYEYAYWLYATGSAGEPLGGTESGGGVEGTALGTGRPPKDTWTHLALTYDHSKERLYVDGELVDTASGPLPQVTGGELVIGGSPEHTDYMDGRLDEVRIYDRALDGAEVDADMETPIQTLKAGPLAAYSFDEGEAGDTTVEDVTGDGHTATIEDGEWARGRYGGGIEFDGKGGTKCVTVPDSPELRLSEEFTLEAWVRPDWGIYEDPVIVRQAGSKLAFGLGLGDKKENSPEGFIGQGKTAKVAYGGEVGGNAWSHVATTYDGSRIRTYVDGELVATEAATTAPATGEGALKIGCDGPDGQFTGRIDEVRVYGRALNGGEVAADEEAPLQTPKRTPVAEYSFDEENSETATDLTGDGHTATVEGAGWTTHGKYGGAMEFDAAEHDVLKIPASEELDFDEEFTLEAWVRPSQATDKEAPLIDKQEGSGLGYFLYEGGSESDVPYGAADPHQEHVEAEDPLPADTWSHVALTFSGNRTYLYVNGELVANGAAEPTVTSEGELEIGGSTDTGEYLDGRIDEVRIYNRELDKAEIAADMEAPIQTPRQGPIAAWSFDEGEGDLVGDRHDGNEGVADDIEWARGKYGDSVRFDGEESCIVVPDSSSLRLEEDFTLEAWVKAEGSTTAGPIFFKESEGTYSYAMAVGFGNEGQPEGAADGEEVIDPDTIEPDVWTHIAFTYDGTTLRLYVDGELVESEHVGELHSASEGPLYIGCDPPAWGDHFSGRIDEARLYERALSPSEIVTDMKTPVELPRPLPIALFEFDEGEGVTAQDSTGGPAATINAASWAEGKFGGALKLASGQSAEVENTDALQMAAGLTIGAWLLPESSGGGAVISKTDQGYEPGEAPDAYTLTLNSSGVPTFKLRTPFGSYAELVGTTALPTGSWSHVTVTAGIHWIAMYVNGERVARATSTAPTTSTGPLLIGAGSGGFIGRIDHVKLYDQSLTEKEVRADATYAGPVIALSGAATEPLPEPPTGEYPLQISSTEGAKGRTEPGVTGLSVSVDSIEQKALHQGCAESNCPFGATWQYKPLEFPGFRHTVTVAAEDKAGVLMARSLRVTTAANDIRTCTAAESGQPVTSESEPGLGGGTIYRYSLGEVHARAPVPPNGFNPLSATNAELAEYDFPARPTNPGQLEAWEATFGEYEGTEGGGAPNPCTTNKSTDLHEAAVNPPNSNQNRSPIWGGYTAYELGYEDEFFQSVEGKIIQPEWHADKCADSEVGSWVGLGGTLGGPLIQEGTEITADGQYGTWYEWLSQDGGIDSHTISPKHFKIEKNDTIVMRTTYTAAENLITFFIWDQSKPKQKPFAEEFQGAWTKQFYDGESAEWIDERPGVNGKPVGLRNFGTVPWFGARAESKFGDSKPIGDWNHSRYTMHAASGSNYDEPAPLGNGNGRFVDYWLRCGA